MNIEAFKKGFLKRANDWNVPVDKAMELWNHVVHEHMGAKGFRKFANIHDLLNFGKDWAHESGQQAQHLYHNTVNNIHGTSKVMGELLSPDPSPYDSDRLSGALNDDDILINTSHELAHNFGNLDHNFDNISAAGRNGAIESAIGAGSGGTAGAVLGGGIGALTSKKHRGRNAGIGAAIGGVLGGIGGGAVGGQQGATDSAEKLYHQYRQDLNADTVSSARRNAKNLMTPEGTKELREILMHYLKGKQ